MTELYDLVARPPAADRGVPAGFVHGAGEWRHVIEVADPGAGTAVVWHDVTTIDGLFTGYDYGRGSDGYQGRYRASVVQLDLYSSTDTLAPWNPDNSATFGTHIELGPGLLIRSGFILVDTGIVTAWNPRFTCKVDSWGDAAYSSGRVRIHRVTARDTMSSLINVPLPARTAENWFERFIALLVDSGWPYGWFAYGARHEVDGTTPILLLPDRPASSSAINELDTICDPAGLVWYTDRLGRLIVRPRVNDTFHAAAFDAGADGTPWPGNDSTHFAWWACQGGAPGEYPGEDHAAYAVDTPSVDSFGFDASDRWVINHVKVTDPTGPGFDDDDPVSIQRFDRKSYQASWSAPNDTVAADMLTLRAYASVEARPLHTNVRLDGFHPGPAGVEYLDPVSIVHRNTAEGLEVFGDGWLRSYTEQVAPLGCDTDWSMSFLVDIHTYSARNTDLLPVEDLTVTEVGDTWFSATWTNPVQVVTPTHTQVRLINPASLWQTVEYPLDGLTWEGLAPQTGYEFQVRLLRIADGLTTHYSPIRAVNFTTLEPAAPYVDPDGNVDLPPPDDGCLVRWRLFSSPDGADPWLLIDIGDDDTPPYEIPDYDFDSLDPDLWYRFTTAEVCDGVEGPQVFGDPFVAGCLGGDRLGTPPYDDPDLIAYWPEVCPNRIIREAVSDGVMIPGHALAGAIGVEDIPVPVLKSATAGGLIGYQIVASTPLGSHDLSIGCHLMIGSQPGKETRVLEYGGMFISIIPDAGGPDPDDDGIRFRGNVLRAADAVDQVTGTTVYSRDTPYELLLTHDPGTGAVALWVEGVLEASHAFTFGDRKREQMRMTLPANSWITDAAAWNKVLTYPVIGPRYQLGTYTGVGGGGAVTETVTEVDGHIVHTFTRSSTVNNGWSMQLIPIGDGPPAYVDFLIVGGGGGGGTASTGNTSCGGGGGGEVTDYFGQPAFVGAATAIVVGNGGGSSTNGTDTTITRQGSSTPDYAAWGGAGGGTWAPGGASGHWASGSGASTGYSNGTPGRGHDGRSGNTGAGFGGGGGGAGAAGFPTPPGTSPRNGGSGKASLMLTGDPIYYGGGGGGGGTIGSGSWSGGIGGGGGTMADAAPNSGGGGGGGQNNFPVESGRSGGYGAFILRYPGTLT